jgi:ACR3 family arsenite efflux pump ArsB
MAAGLLLGRLIPGLGDALSSVEIDGISLPIAIGLLIMMYPVLAKVRYDRLDAINSVFQVIMFAVLGWFYLSVLPGWLGLEQTTISTSPWQIAKSVLIFLGIPLLAGYLTRRFGEKTKGRDWYEQSFPPKIGPWALYG